MSLYPRTNAARMAIDLSGVWDFRLHEGEPWQTIAVPASYNDQKADPAFRAHVGLAWYRTRITVPTLWKDMDVALRFDAVTHSCRVLLDGAQIGAHRGGFLPFSIDLTGLIAPGETKELVVEVDNTISHKTLPVGNESGVAFFGSDNAGIPAVEAGKRRQREQGINLPNFDFFNYAGITRPVRLYATHKARVTDISLDAGMDGVLRYAIAAEGEGEPVLTVLDAEGKAVASARGMKGEVTVKDARLWEPVPGTPYLYTAHITFGEDIYDQPFGFRSVKVDGIRCLINGKPFHFHGPDKHEDFFLHGRGKDDVVNVNDISLFHWLHANAFRTSHYPYAEEMYDLCDREGIVIIDETPAVGISGGAEHDPYTEWEGLYDYHREVLEAMIARDRNHPCVVMWSLGNEPDTWSFPQSSYDYWHALYEEAHRLDPQDRPVTMVGCQNDYTRDITTPSMDVVCFNRYYGWYNLSGDLENAAYAMRQELDWWDHIGKPVMLTEYGADTINGLHGCVPEMFTEEFQVAYYETINACLDERPYVIGELPWNFADFNTQPSPMRSGGNRKGLFTRDRKPKMVAHYFRKRWEDFKK